ncbi:ABC transporter ATP-binding protein [Consotaella aegiceratis]|uniref:ABC transporter ATP-binding protein n=1 Tax=Consotaella aegiceratis TaxID=3097961 RepID=UPI002F401332
MSGLSLHNVKKRFGSVEVIHGVDLSVEPGEFCVFVGPSGCGKSTLLRMIAGLEQITEGEITIGGRRVNEVDPSRRGVAMVFQTYALYPHMTAEQNMGFGLRMNGMPKAEVAARVAKAAGILQIGELLARKPKQLSGGQRQRVAIGRAIVRDPDVFLFDEPLSNLDAELRVATRVEIAKLHSRLDGATMIYVTHDQVEAMTLASKIVVLRAGRVEQIGSPMELYHRPANLFVAGFIGSPKMNFFPVDVEQNGRRAWCRLHNGTTVELAVDDGVRADTAATLGVRADQLALGDAGTAPITGTVSVVERLGDAEFVYVAGAGDKEIIARFDGDVAVKVGSPIALDFKGRLHFFDEAGLAIEGIRSATAVPAAVAS